MARFFYCCIFSSAWTKCSLFKNILKREYVQQINNQHRMVMPGPEHVAADFSSLIIVLARGKGQTENLPVPYIFHTPRANG